MFTAMNGILENGLNIDSPMVEPPPEALKVSLRSHQRAAIARMEKMENTLVNGMDCSGETFYSSYGIMGDLVGSGKSLMVLAHIARLSILPPLAPLTSMGQNSANHVFSICREIATDVNNAGCLIVIPHTLFRQWADYIKRQTNISHILLDKKKVFTSETFKRDLLAADIVLVSNTQYKELSMWQHENKILWKRVFIDEADTIHMVNGYPKPIAQFTWFITASWVNMIFPHDANYVQQAALHAFVFGENAIFSRIKPYFEDVYHLNRSYHYMRYNMTSYNFFKDTINAYHSLRGKLVMRCDDEFVRQSISLPILYRTNITCRAPLTQQIVSAVVPLEVQQLLHGGDILGAISALGVKTEDATGLIEAVTMNLKKELSRLKATYTFKAELEYSTPQIKEAALKSLDEKIKSKEASIKSMHDRIEGFKDDICPICYDEPSQALVTPCCSRVFCGQCILTCITRSTACPMCRTAIPIKNLTKFVLKKDETAIVEVEQFEEQLEKKADALLRIFKENPEGRFLVFSRYDNPFTSMEDSITGLGIRVKQLKGNKDAIASTLKAFQGGDLRCLLLNSHYAGSGLNITAATHVILLHAMTHEEEKQILGRAYRMGRTAPLHFIRLLHQDEMPTTN